MAWRLLKTLVFALVTQHAASQMVIRVLKSAKDILKPVGFDPGAQKGSEDRDAAKATHTLAVLGSGHHGGTGAVLGDQMARQLHDDDDGCYIFIIFQITWRFRRLQTGSPVSPTEVMTVAMNVTITDPQNGPVSFPVEVSVGADAQGAAEFPLLPEQINGDGSGLCDACTLSAVAGECLSGDCDRYDRDATNANMDMEPTVCGDPHMVGLLGQRIDWYGEDKGWYCLLVDSRFHVNTRVSAPMPQEFPTRQLISGVSLMTADGHSLVIEVKNPYTTATGGCFSSSPTCLAEGALRILVDGAESKALQTPGEGIDLPGGVVVSSANLPAECRPFGGDRIWAAEYAAMDTATGRRSLRAGTPFVDWLLEADTIAAPDWCAKFVIENGSAGMSKVQSNHAIIRIETPSVTLRVNIGVNYQEPVLDADGNLLVPELEFWQTDLAFEGLLLSGEVGGMLGDTSSFALDHDGMPITSGMVALHGPVESYRVPGSLGANFEQQLH